MKCTFYRPETINTEEWNAICSKLRTDLDELETGRVIASHFEQNGINPKHMPCVLARHHGPFAWGKDALEAVHNAVVLEEVAMMAWHTEALPQAQTRENLPEYVKEKHFMRKHGPNAYYGQKK